ncbi:MAG: HD domain-containing phosphohydrolase [Pseudomonadota bacterium]
MTTALPIPSILVVDDDPDICDMLTEGIAAHGYRCRSVSDAESAVTAVARQRVDVVVTDIRMPGMSGIELCRAVRASTAADVIIMTGFTQDVTYEEMVANGASDFIQKPVSLAEFMARLKRVIGERALRAERNHALEDIQWNLARFQRAMDGIIHAMCRAVEMRDPYTAGHQERVARLAAGIGESIGLDADRVYGIRMVGRIHDIGKIIIPSEILCKPGELSAPEFEIIKTHSRAGSDILSTIEFPWPLAQVVLQHHERLDGSGYPAGLTGEDILMEARVLSVADVFETMSTHRPYRPALGMPRALVELETNRGRLYDAAVVDACVDLVRRPTFSLDEKKWEASVLEASHSRR